MKALLKKVVGEHVLRWDEFLTILATAAAKLNSRLLAPVESTSDDGIEPFTPGHFLLEDVPYPLYLMYTEGSLHSGSGTSQKYSHQNSAGDGEQIT